MSLTAERPATVPIVERRPIRLWSPAQLIALVLGVGATVFGVIALVRTGIDFSHLTGSHGTVFGFGQTQLAALAEIGFGALLVIAALFPILGRNVMTLVGAATLGLGIVVLGGWWSAKMQAWLGAGDRDAWLFIAAGGFVLFTSFFTPVFTWGGPRVVRRAAQPEPTPEPVAEPERAAEPEPERGGEPEPVSAADQAKADRTEPGVPPERHDEPTVPAFVSGHRESHGDGSGESTTDAERSEDDEKAPVDATRA